MRGGRIETAGRGPEGAGEHNGRGEGPGRPAPRRPAAASVGLTGDGMRRVALEEMALRRRRLGELTPAQERALESLLVSVADSISELVSEAADRAPRHERGGEEAFAPTVNRLEAVSPARS